MLEGIYTVTPGSCCSVICFPTCLAGILDRLCPIGNEEKLVVFTVYYSMSMCTVQLPDVSVYTQGRGRGRFVSLICRF